MGGKRLATLLGGRKGFKQTVRELTDRFIQERSDALATIHPALQLPHSELGHSSSQTPTQARGNSLFDTETSPGTLAQESKQRPKGSNDNSTCSLIEKTAEAENIFKAALRDYEATAKYKTGVNLDCEHNIDQVSKIIDDSIHQNQIKDTEGLWGKVLQAFRKFGENGKAVEGWLGLLPTESAYLSVVSGGLKLIVKAAIRMRDVATSVLDGLRQIPSILGGAQQVMKLFYDDEMLQNQSRQLYMSVLAALGHMLEYLKQNRVRKAWNAVSKQGNFASDLEQKIKTVETERNTFNQQANISYMERTTKSQRVNSEEIREARTAYEAEFKRAQRFREVILSVLDSNGNQRPEKLVNKMLMDSPIASNAAYQIRKRINRPRGVPEFDPQLCQPAADAVSGGKAFVSFPHVREFLLSQLDYDANVAGADVVNNYTLGTSLFKDERERSMFVIESQLFDNWIQAEGSTALIVNGNSKRVTGKSGLSFICARLIHALDELRCPDTSSVQRPEIITVHFFCARHGTKDESWESPKGIINSLLAQLLQQCQYLDIPKLANLGKVDNRSLKNIFSWFQAVFDQLPHNVTVFCVLDAISIYVDSFGEDAKLLVANLLKLSRERNPKGASLKIFITARSRLLMSSLELGEVEILSLRKVLRDRGGFKTMKWNATVSKLSKSLK
ncbi:hypothetical protein F4782DRAFT_534516 [Xylaria castorea]|nr:hypothetical protein F4782DRAFT_534516 [Xylaria castorea]